MKTILVVGVGRFGLRIIKKLSEMNIQVMAIDQNEERARAAVPYATNIEIGDAANRDFLESLGVRNFDKCIVAIGDNFLASLEVTSLLKELGARYVLSRAARTTQEKFLLRNGADEVVYPEKQMANWTALRAASDSIFDYLELNDEYAIFEVRVPKEWAGHSIRELDVRNRYHVNIMAVRHDNDIEIAVGNDFRLESGQMMLVLGNQKDIRACFRG